MVATGQTGKNPFICVWDTTTMETVSILQDGHQNGVAAVGFDKEGGVRKLVFMYQNLNFEIWTNIFLFRLFFHLDNEFNKHNKSHTGCLYLIHWIRIRHMMFVHHIFISACGFCGLRPARYHQCMGLEKRQDPSNCQGTFRQGKYIYIERGFLPVIRWG